MSIILTDNQFFTGLANLAVITRLYSTNTSRRPENFVESFATETLANGDSKMYPFADLPAVVDYSETSSLLEVTKVDTIEERIKINNFKLIKSSYNGYYLEMAFADGDGVNQFVGYIIGQMESAKTKFMYEFITNQLFTRNFVGSQLKTITLTDRTSVTTPHEINQADLLDAKAIAKELQTVEENVQIYNTIYNPRGYSEALDISDMKFVWCAPYKYDQIINLYGTLLKSEIISDAFENPEFLTIPAISIPTNDKTIGFLMHKKAYEFFYKFVYMGSFFDESNVTVNHFLHFWFGEGWHDSLPQVKFAKA